jgi:hypothetical protein
VTQNQTNRSTPNISTFLVRIDDEYDVIFIGFEIQFFDDPFDELGLHHVN